MVLRVAERCGRPFRNFALATKKLLELSPERLGIRSAALVLPDSVNGPPTGGFRRCQSHKDPASIENTYPAPAYS